MDFLDRFECVDYPELATDPILPIGILHCYVSRTFLSGWINYVKIERAFLRTRYEEHADNLAAAERFDLEERFHTDLGSIFEDEIEILARDPDGRVWFFGYDPDVSDCSIGRLDDAPTLIEEFVERNGGEIELPIDRFMGWISF